MDENQGHLEVEGEQYSEKKKAVGMSLLQQKQAGHQIDKHLNKKNGKKQEQVG